MKIWLIDDDETFNFLNRRIIERAGIASEIRIYNSAYEVMRDFSDGFSDNDSNPDLIFLDIRMPVMDGFLFLEEIKNLPENRGNNLKVVVLSSSLEDSDRVRSFEFEQVVDFINKPLSRDKLMQLCRKIQE